MLYSAGYVMKRVHIVLSGLRMRLFICVHVCISCRYDWLFVFAMIMSMCVDVMVMLSAYIVSFTDDDCGAGMYDVYTYILHSVGDRTPPCGTPVLNWRYVDVLFLNIV